MADRPEREPTTFAEQLKRLQESRGLSQAQLARDLWVYDGNVARWRSGKGIEIENVRKIADYFGVDRAWLEELAGYGDNHLSLTKEAAGDTINPEIAAMLDAERAQIEEQLLGIPPAFWNAILAAQREARRIAVDMAHAAIELTTGAPISTPRADELAPPGRQRRKNNRRGDSPPDPRLAAGFRLVAQV